MKDYIFQKFKKLIGVNIKSYSKDDFDTSFDTYIINDAYVVRSGKKIKDPLYFPKYEQEIIDLLKDKNISEKVLYFSNMNGFKISRVIHKSIKKNILTNVDITRLAKQLKRLHSFEDKPKREFAYFENISSLKKNIPIDQYIDQKYESVVISKTLMQFLEDKHIFSHNYLLKENICFRSNEIKFLRFDFSTSNSPLYDLAFVSNEYNFSEDVLIFFLKKYFGHTFKKRYIKMIKIYQEYQNILNYYHNLYLFIKIGDIKYLDLASNYKKKFNNKL